MQCPADALGLPAPGARGTFTCCLVLGSRVTEKRHFALGEGMEKAGVMPEGVGRGERSLKVEGKARAAVRCGHRLLGVHSRRSS